MVFKDQSVYMRHYYDYSKAATIVIGINGGGTREISCILDNKHVYGVTLSKLNP